MQVTDKNVTDLMNADVVSHQLHLGAFTAINKEVVVLYGKVLAGGESSVCRQCPTGAEDGEPEGQCVLCVHVLRC